MIVRVSQIFLGKGRKLNYGQNLPQPRAWKPKRGDPAQEAEEGQAEARRRIWGPFHQLLLLHANPGLRYSNDSF